MHPEKARLNWKRSKLSNPEWIAFTAPCAVGGEYVVHGTGDEYVAGYHRPRSRRGNFTKIGTATNVVAAAALAQADNDRRLADRENEQ
jgi:hypothetical protein